MLMQMFPLHIFTVLFPFLNHCAMRQKHDVISICHGLTFSTRVLVQVAGVTVNTLMWLFYGI